MIRCLTNNPDRTGIRVIDEGFALMRNYLQVKITIHS